jgi:hypothetical protein
MGINLVHEGEIKLVASKYTKSMTLEQVLRGIHRLQDNVYLADIENKVKGHTILLNLLKPFKDMDEDEIENELNTTYKRIVTDFQTDESITETIDGLVDRLMPFIPFLESDEITDDDLSVEGKNTYLEAIINDTDKDRQKKLSLILFDKIKDIDRHGHIPKKDKLALLDELSDMDFGEITLDNYDKLPQVNYVLLTVTTNGTPQPQSEGNLVALGEGWVKVKDRRYQKILNLEDKNTQIKIVEKDKERFTTNLTEKLKLVFETEDDFLKLYYEITPPPMLEFLGANLIRTKVEPKDEKIEIIVDENHLFFNYAMLLNSINDQTNRHLLLPKIEGQAMGMLAEKSKRGYVINQYFTEYLESEADNKIKAIISSLNLQSYFTKEELEKKFSGHIDSKHFFPRRLIKTILDEGRLSKYIPELEDDLGGTPNEVIVRLKTETANKLNMLLGGSTDDSKEFIQMLNAIDRKTKKKTTKEYEGKDIDYDLYDDNDKYKGTRLEALEAKYAKEKSNLTNEKEIQEAKKRYEAAKEKIESYEPSIPTYVKLAPKSKEQRFEDLGQVEAAILYSAVLDHIENAQILQYSPKYNYKGSKTVKKAIKAYYSIAHAFSGEEIDNLVDELHDRVGEIIGDNSKSTNNLDNDIDGNVESLKPLLAKIHIELEEALKEVKDSYKAGIFDVLEDMAMKPRKYKRIQGILERAKAKKLLKW